MNSIQQFSVVVPVYNSETVLRELCITVDTAFKRLNAPYELILVNDCSTDASWNLIKLLKEDYPQTLIGIHLRRTTGTANALLCGFQFVKGTYVITISDDPQFALENITLLITKIKTTSADLVIGISTSQFDSQIGVFNIVNRKALEIIKEHNTSFVRAQEALSWLPLKVEKQPVKHQASNKNRRRHKDASFLLPDFNRRLNEATLPLRFMTWLGLTSFWICFILIGYFVYLKIVNGSPMGFTALIVSIFMSSGLILFSLGVIGEYLHRLFALEIKILPYEIGEILP